MTSPDLRLPAGACDTHMHAFGPAAKYPPAAGALYGCPDAPAEKYLAMAQGFGIARQVFVQPSYYRDDNAYLLSALARMGATARGVVMLQEGATDRRMLIDLHARGVRGIRLDLVRASKDGRSAGEMTAMVASAAATAATMGWSIDLYAPGPVSFALAPHLPDLPAPCSIAHLGYLKVGDGLTDAQCDDFIQTVSRGNVWIKLTGTYRFDEAHRADRLAARFLDVMPDRLIWGSDWPHVMAPPQEVSASIRWLQNLAGQGATYQSILVDNPSRLYGFTS